MKLRELAETIRSKNAGVDHITFDIIFRDQKIYEKVKRSGSITLDTITTLYRLEPECIVRFVYFDPANAIKFTIRRKRASGGMGESDVFGCQQYSK